MEMQYNNSESKIFKSEQELKSCLAELFSKIKNVDDYNIFVHQIYAHVYNREDRDLSLEDRVNGILTHGISTYRYPTITATAKFAGALNSVDDKMNVDPQDIINYNYYNSPDRYVCILAIPKFVDVDGKRVEFSSLEGLAGEHCRNSSTQEIMSETLRESYKSIGVKNIQVRETKFSLLDVIGNDSFNKNYLLGICHVDPEEHHYGILLSHEHLYENADTNKAHNDYFADKIENLYDKFQTKDTATLIAKGYYQEKLYWDTKLMEDID